MLSRMRLQTCSLALLGRLAVVIMVSMVTFLAVRVRTITREEAFDKCTRIAQGMSADFGEDRAEAMGASRVLARQVEACVTRQAVIDRPSLARSVQAILESNPFFYGVWFQAEPGRFDGRDAEESAAAAVTLASQAGVLRGIVSDLPVLVEGSAGSST